MALIPEIAVAGVENPLAYRIDECFKKFLP